MYQPAQLDSFIRLLICHLGNVLTQGEQLIDNQSNQARMELLQIAIEQGAEITSQAEHQQDCEMLFALQMIQSREWVDRLGQLDPQVERDTDEFLAATFPIEKLVRDREACDQNYNLQNIMTRSQNDCALHDELTNYVNVEAMMCAIFELLGRLEEQYDLIEELFEQKHVVNGVPFGAKYSNNQSAKIIPLFAADPQIVAQDNDD